MEKKYKDILIVRCRPSSRDGSADRLHSKEGSPHKRTSSSPGYNGLSKTDVAKINDKLARSCVTEPSYSLNCHPQPFTDSKHGKINGLSNGYHHSRLDENCNLLPRKVSAPPEIAITAGGFHFAGRLIRDDCLPQYMKVLESTKFRSNEPCTKSVPGSPTSGRRTVDGRGALPTKLINRPALITRPTRASVTVDTRGSLNPDRELWSPSDDKFLKHPLSKISVVNARLARSDDYTSLIESATAAGAAAGTAAACDVLRSSSLTESPFDYWSHVPRSPVAERRRSSKIGNKSSCRKTGVVGTCPPYSNGESLSNMEQTSSEVTMRDLTLMLQSVKPNVGPLPGHEMDRTPRYLAGVCMDECYPGLYIGDIGAAKDRAYLKRVGITHVLNTAEGNKMCTVDTNAHYYKEVNIKYLGLQLLDIPSANISQFFEQGAEFIDDCLNEGGKVLVHCFMGISRSSTIAASFLMLKRGMPVLEALTVLRRHRSIYPNDGFLHQLLQLDRRLAQDRKPAKKH
ncbi:Dual specificity phosphatase catalytic domain [Trinorchestia longiramus]|nr:Dual specificity phosphatase catalytic domain [Trinorchestia longiramus]